MSVVNVKVKYIRPEYDNLKEWCKDEKNVYIGRAGVVFVDGERYPKESSIFANPFKIGKDGNRVKVISQYEQYLKEKIEKDENFKEEIIKLKNKNLGCWCKPEMCHGDILINYINK